MVYYHLSLFSLKFVATISIIFVMFMAQSPLNQLLKFPILVNHFLEHKQKKSTLSFIDFIKEHYSDNINHDNDSDRDMQLPFKKCISPFFTFVIIQDKINISVSSVFHGIEKPNQVFFSFWNPQNNLTSIWQPPKQLSV